MTSLRKAERVSSSPTDFRRSTTRCHNRDDRVESSNKVVDALMALAGCTSIFTTVNSRVSPLVVLEPLLARVALGGIKVNDRQIANASVELWKFTL